MTVIRPSPKEAIIEAAFQLYSENPAASLADIATRAGIGRATLHRHFKGRNDLITELARTAIKEIDQVAENAAANAESYTQALMLSMQAIIPLADKYWFLYRESAEEHSGLQIEYQRQTDELIQIIDEAKKEGSFDIAIPTIWVAKAYDNLIFTAWEVVRKGEMTSKQATDMAWHTLLNGIGINSNG